MPFCPRRGGASPGRQRIHGGGGSCPVCFAGKYYSYFMTCCALQAPSLPFALSCTLAQIFLIHALPLALQIDRPAVQIADSNIKTRMCISWKNTGTCKFGGRCHFAHGEEELRPAGSASIAAAAAVQFASQVKILLLFHDMLRSSSPIVAVCSFVHLGANISNTRPSLGSTDRQAGCADCRFQYQDTHVHFVEEHWHVQIRGPMPFCPRRGGASPGRQRIHSGSGSCSVCLAGDNITIILYIIFDMPRTASPIPIVAVCFFVRLF
jgi:hypothetical protein